jgi:ubiquinone/menaquinone biosynthesis C-methylase UbiE
MPIKKVINSIEKYREIAKSLTDRHMLTGRGSDKEFTSNRISYIKKNISQMADSFDNMLDVGCGDGSFMESLIQLGNNFVGVLPTQEETEVVKRLLKNSKNITVIQGLSTNLPFKDKSKQFILCNSVLHSVGFNDDLVKKSLYEFYRILTDDGILYVGEIPELNEMEGRDYGTSFYKYLIWVLKNRGILFFFNQLLEYFTCLFSKKIYTLQPTNMYFCSNIEFKDLLNKIGFKVRKIYDSENNNTIFSDDKSIKDRRLDYVCIKSN